MRPGGSFPICLSDDNLYTIALIRPGLESSIEPRIHVTFRRQVDFVTSSKRSECAHEMVLEVLYDIREQFSKSSFILWKRSGKNSRQAEKNICMLSEIKLKRHKILVFSLTLLSKAENLFCKNCSV